MKDPPDPPSRRTDGSLPPQEGVDRSREDSVGDQNQSGATEQNAEVSWDAVIRESENGLRAFLRSRLRQTADVDDCMQAVLLAVVEKGQDVAPAARRAWLFRVAANAAARFWRDKSATDRVLEKQASYVTDAEHFEPERHLDQSESLAEINRCIERLPPQWQTILRLRIQNNQTFQSIADQLGIPIGTALTQMRRAIERIQNELSDHDAS